ncbi:MAG: GNAT family N-acetyltransferase [Chloroflexota bacterium]
MNITYHGTAKRYLESLDPLKPYLPAAFAADGFIHCTDGRQAVSIILTINYREDPEPYVYLCIDKDRVTSEVRYDDPARIYPHIYGPLNRDAIIAVLPAARAEDGTFLMPAELSEPATPQPAPHVDPRAAATAIAETVTLTGPRVTLRVGRAEDAESIFRHANHPVIAAMTGMPHPYPGVEGALHWIESTWTRLAAGAELHLAITLSGEDEAIGYIGLNSINRTHKSAELGYWIAEPYWGRGLVTEAARLLVDHGFRELGLNRIYARCRDDNRRSYRVMEKLGMKLEGVMRQEAFRDGQFLDQRHYAILRQEWPGI